MPTISLLGMVLMIGFVVWCFLDPFLASWVYIGLFVLALQGWLYFMSWRLGRLPIAAHTPPFDFTNAEAELICRHGMYFFRFPGASREFSSVLASIGMASWILIPWLLYQRQWPQTAILFVNLFIGGPLSHKLSPLNGLAVLARRGNGEAQKLLEAHDPAWEKIVAVSKARRFSQAPK